MTLFLPTLIGSTVVLDLSAFFNLIMFSIITNTFFWYFLSRKQITWKEGLIFLLIYVLFLITTISGIQPLAV
jgi:Ca2+/Na+ antiporter